MKRLFYLAFAALAVFACNPEQPETPGGKDKPNPDPTPDVTGGYDSISVTLKDANLKAEWAEGDILQVYAVTAEGADIEAKYALAEGAGTATGKFAPAAGETALPKGGKDYFAAYPYDEDRTFAQHNTFTVVVPAEQTGANPIFAHAADAATMEISSFMGAVKFTLNGKAELKGFALEDANSNSILSGNVTFNAKTGKATFKNSSATKHEISYMLPDKLVLNGASDPFVIEVPAGTLADGGKITLFDMNDNAAAVLEFPAQTISAGAIADLGELSFQAVSQTVDLSIAGTANCYIIPSTGVYKFKAVKGNSNDEVDAASVEVFWETREDTDEIEAGTIIKSVALEEGYVVVETADPSVPGNALIAAKNADGDIIWSWHLWLPETTVATVPDPDMSFWKTEVMDRNLGAMVPVDTTATALEKTYGLFYQWGRKDPLVGPFTVAGTETVGLEKKSYDLSYWTAHPNELTEGDEGTNNYLTTPEDYWDENGEKTMYDPCPVGYRVPVYDNEYAMWIKRDDTTWSFNQEKLWFYFKETEIAFPLCGYLSASSSPSKLGIRALIWSATPGLGDEHDVRGSAGFFDLSRDSGKYYYHSYFRYAAGNIRCAKEH
ncbi:MAG: hypothetical protein IKS71_04970 [Bacteroidales bacterium]|nr:hypothetical protein [Bacteroidales bacterium]